MLAFDEERHAEIISEALGFNLDNYLHFQIPPQLSYVKKTIDFAKETKKKLVNKNVSVKEVLGMVKKLHELKNESYYHDLLEKETVDRVKKFFRRFFEIDKLNLDLIQKVMAKYGIEGER